MSICGRALNSPVNVVLCFSANPDLQGFKNLEGLETVN